MDHRYRRGEANPEGCPEIPMNHNQTLRGGSAASDPSVVVCLTRSPGDTDIFDHLLNMLWRWCRHT